MRMIKLTKITADRPNFHTDTDEPGEGGEAILQTTPVSINVDAIRCFYPRKDNRVGTRLTFVDGGGFAVTELYDEVAGLVSPN